MPARGRPNGSPDSPGPAGAPALPGLPEPPELLRPRVTCRRCHRPLHDPESRLLRLGPECRGPVERVPRHEVDQEPLPGVDGAAAPDA